MGILRNPPDIYGVLTHQPDIYIQTENYLSKIAKEDIQIKIFIHIKPLAPDIHKPLHASAILLELNHKPSCT